MLRHYLAIARPDHWFKNIFVLPGVAVALLLEPGHAGGLTLPLLLGLAATCLTASANYVINEYLDREFDRHHPTKRLRPSAQGLIRPVPMLLEYLLLAAAGLGLGWLVGTRFAIFAAILLGMGLIYNVPPVRTKDRIFLDVLSESVNNPLRFLLGWSIVIQAALPPSSVLLAYWCGGAFLMSVKRYAEYRHIDDPARAGAYRRSFAAYTEGRLLLQSFFYAINSSFFLGIFLIKYRIEFLLSFPFFAALFTWYLYIGLKADSAAQAPERLWREWRFMLFVGLLAAVVLGLFFVDIPLLHRLLQVNVY